MAPAAAPTGGDDDCRRSANYSDFVRPPRLSPLVLLLSSFARWSTSSEGWVQLVNQQLLLYSNKPLQLLARAFCWASLFCFYSLIVALTSATLSEWYCTFVPINFKININIKLGEILSDFLKDNIEMKIDTSSISFHSSLTNTPSVKKYKIV